MVGWTIGALGLILVISIGWSVRPRGGLFNNIADEHVAMAEHRAAWAARTDLRQIRLNDVARMSLERNGFCVLEPDASWPAADGAQIECQMLTPMPNLVGMISEYVWVHRYRRVGPNWYRLAAVHRSISK